MKKNWKRMCALFTAVAMCVSTPNFTVVAEENTSVSATTIVSNGDSIQERYVLPFSLQREELKVCFQVVNQWEGGYQAEIILSNEGNNPIEDWQIDFGSSDTITNIWGGTVLQNEEKSCSVAADDYNNVLNMGETVTIGYCAEGLAYDIINLEVKCSASVDSPVQLI